MTTPPAPTSPAAAAADHPPTIIVCDIDNTLKQGNKVWSTPPIEGMPQLVHDLVKSLSPCRVVYLTNRYGPFSVIGDPAAWIKKNGFPEGQVMARSWTDFKGYITRAPTHKKNTLRPLLEKCHTCVLLGDSGENDALVYVDTLKAHVDRSPSPQATSLSSSPPAESDVIPGVRGKDDAGSSSDSEAESKPGQRQESDVPPVAEVATAAASSLPSSMRKMVVGIRLVDDVKHKAKMDAIQEQWHQTFPAEEERLKVSRDQDLDTMEGHHMAVSAKFCLFKTADDLRKELAHMLC